MRARRPATESQRAYAASIEDVSGLPPADDQRWSAAEANDHTETLHDHAEHIDNLSSRVEAGESDIAALKSFDLALTDASTKQLILARNAPADGVIPHEVLDLAGTDAQPLDKAVVKFVDYLVFYGLDGTWAQGPRIESVAAEKLNPLHLQRNAAGEIEQITGRHLPTSTAYLEGLSIVIGSNGLVYIANTTEKWRAANDRNSGAPDLTDPPELGSAKDAWTHYDALAGTWHYETMQGYITGGTEGQRVENAMLQVSLSGGGQIIVANKISLVDSDDIYVNGNRSNVNLLALHKGVEIEAVGEPRSQMIRMQDTTRNAVIQGFTIKGNGLVSGFMCGLAGTGCGYVGNTITDTDQELWFKDNGKVTTARGVQVTDTCESFKVNGNDFTDIAVGLSLPDKDVGKLSEIVGNTFSKYSARGMLASPHATAKNRISVRGNVFYNPPNLPNANGDVTGIVKQPLAFQENGAALDAKWEHIDFIDNYAIFTGAPYVNDNPSDSPGEASNAPSLSVADVFAFNRAESVYVRFPTITGGGEVGAVTASNGVDLLVVDGGLCTYGDVCAVNAGSGNQDPAYRVGKVIIRNVEAFKPSRDLNGDHRNISPFLFNDVDEVVIHGCSTTTNTIEQAYDVAATYSAGERVTHTFNVADSLSGVTWESLVDNNSGNTPTEGANWTRKDIAEPIRHNVIARDVKKFSEFGNSWGESTHECVLLAGATAVQRIECLTEATDTTWPNFIDGSTNNNQLIWMPDVELGVFQTPDGKGGRRTVVAPNSIQYQASFTNSGALIASHPATNISQNAVVANTNEYTITLDTPLLDVNVKARAHADSTATPRLITTEVKSTTQIMVRTFTASGVATPVAFTVEFEVLL